MNTALLRERVAQVRAAYGAWHARRGLADRIMLSSLAMTLGLLTVFGAAGYFALQHTELNRIRADLAGSAASARELIQRDLMSLVNTVSDASGHALVGNALADSRHSEDILYPFLRDTVKAHPEIEAIGLVDYRGDSISQYGKDFPAAVSLAELASKVISTEAPTAMLLPTPEGAQIVLAYPVFYLPTNHIEGAIVAQIQGASLLTPAIKSRQASYSVEIFSRSGLAVASVGKREDGKNFRIELPLNVKMPNFPLPELDLVIETPESAAYASLHTMQTVYLAAALLGALLSAVLARRLGKNIARPIEALSQAARSATEQGHAAIQAVSVLGDRELVELATTFNEMGRSLADAHAELEARVEARTAELRAAREQLREIFDSVDEVVYSTGADFTEVPLVSAAALPIFGHEPQAFAQQPTLWRDSIHPDDRARAMAARARAADTGGAEIDYRIVRADGAERWLRDRFSVRRDATTKNVVSLSGIASDITAAVRADEALRTLHRAIQASSAGVLITDCTQPDNPVVMVNPAFERITGYRQDEVLGSNCRFLQGADSDEIKVDKLRAAIREKRDCKVILKNYRKDGSPFWNELSVAPVEDGSGRITRFVGIMNDITALVDYQNQILQWADRVDTIFKLSPDGFVSIDRGGRVSYANPAFLVMTGIPSDALLGMSALTLDARMASLCDQAHPYPALAEDMLAEDVAPSAAPQSVLYLRQPAPLTLRRLVRRAPGEIVSTIVYFRDVTREMEVDRMKSEFLTTAAHELRTPMASIMGFAELLLNREFPPEQRREYLLTIHQQSRRLTGLLNDLLDLARIEARRKGALVMGWHRLDDIARQAVGAVLVANDSRKVVLRLDEGLPSVYVDASKLQQALMNLVSNAYKYSAGRGEIELETVSRSDSPVPMVGLRVIDHGIGMTPAEQARAFERFFRADATGAIPGTGLGLSLVKEIIETHGGHVDLESTFGEGTRVTLWLPLSVAARQDAEQSEEVAA